MVIVYGIGNEFCSKAVGGFREIDGDILSCAWQWACSKGLFIKDVIFLGVGGKPKDDVH